MKTQDTNGTSLGRPTRRGRRLEEGSAPSGRRALLRHLAVVGVACSIAGCQGAEEPTDIDERVDPSGGLVLDGLELRVVEGDASGVPTFVTGRLGSIEPKSGSAEVDLTDVVSELSPLFHANVEDLALERVDTDSLGDRHIRLTQTRNGLEVLGGELVLHVRDDIVYAVNGSARGDLPAPDSAVIDPSEARSLALQETSLLDDVTADVQPRLAYRQADGAMDLVYLVDVAAVRRDGLPVRDTVLVSAVDGSIVERIPHIHTARNREMHDAGHGSTLPGPTVRTEGGPATSDPVVNTNYDLLGSTYACYQQLFGRDSYDNAGAKLVSTVHYRVNYNNAFWNGSQMAYGDGDGVTFSNLANSMDVTAHELTHAVTSKTSKLVYSGASGGLNEAMSDIFGNVCEWHRDGQVVSADTWKVGEDIWTPGTGGDALRYMNTPRADGSSLDWYPDFYPSIDVHYSSGIANLAFYLLSQGGSHPRGKTSTVMTGIGVAKAAQVFYRANAFIMTSNTNFHGAKTATEQAAIQLGYSLAERAAVTAAWQSVGVSVAGSCGHNLCTSGDWAQPGCDAGGCAASVCSADPYCCSYAWDDICVDEASTICGLGC